MHFQPTIVSTYDGLSGHNPILSRGGSVVHGMVFGSASSQAEQI